MTAFPENIWFSRQGVIYAAGADQAQPAWAVTHSVAWGEAQPTQYDAQEKCLQSFVHWADSGYCLQSLPGVLYQGDFTKVDSE